MQTTNTTPPTAPPIAAPVEASDAAAAEEDEEEEGPPGSRPEEGREDDGSAEGLEDGPGEGLGTTATHSEPSALGDRELNAQADRSNPEAFCRLTSYALTLHG